MSQRNLSALEAGTRAARLLHVWEQGTALPPWERALLVAAELAASGEYDESGAVFAELPIGHTHRLVLLWRSQQFGEELAVTATCPACSCAVEFGLDIAALVDTKPIVPSGTLVHGDHTLDWRCPTPSDLLAVAGVADALAALRLRCVSVAGGIEVVSPEVWEAVDHQLAEADPLAEIVVDVGCPECAHSFGAGIDPVGFVWAEVEAHAARVLHEVDLLARAYAWSESDILSLGEARRAAYLRLVVDGAP